MFRQNTLSVSQAASITAAQHGTTANTGWKSLRNSGRHNERGRVFIGDVSIEGAGGTGGGTATRLPGRCSRFASGEAACGHAPKKAHWRQLDVGEPDFLKNFRVFGGMEDVEDGCAAARLQYPCHFA